MVAAADLERHVEAGEALRYHAPLRRGGHVGVTDDRVLVVRGEETTSVELAAVAEVTVQSFDWFLGLLSGGLVGFGLLSTGRSAIGGLLFAAFGLASLFWTYRKRGKVQLHLHNRRKAVTFYPEPPEAFREALGEALDRYRERMETD